MNKALELIRRSRNLSTYFVAAIVPMLCSLVLNPFVSLYMEKEDFAITGYYTSFCFLILPFVSFAFMQYYSKAYYHHDEAGRQRLLNTIQSAQLLFGGMALVLILIGYYVYHRYRDISIPYFPFAILAFLAIYLESFYTNYQTKLKFERRAGTFLKMAVAKALIHSCGVILLIITLRLKAYGFFFATTITASSLAIISLRKTLTRFHIDAGQLKTMTLFCWPLVLGNLMEYVYSGLDRSLLVGQNNHAELGLYNIAVTIGSYVSIFYTAISQTFQPNLFENVAKRDVRGTVKTFSIIQALNTAPILLFFLFTPLLIDILTFGRYTAAAPYARVIALKGIFAAMFYSLSTIIIAAGKSKVMLASKAIGAIVIYALLSLLIRHFSYMGAAWGQALSYLVMTFISLAYILYKRKEIF